MMNWYFAIAPSESSFFNLSKASAITEDGSTTKIGVDGFCKANQFAMGRSAVLSQVYLTKSSTASAPFGSVRQRD